MIPSNIILIAPTNSGKSIMIKYILSRLNAFRYGHVYLASGGKARNFYTEFMPSDHVKVLSNDDDSPSFVKDIEEQMKRSRLYCDTLTFLKDYVCKGKRQELEVVHKIEKYGTLKYLDGRESHVFKIILERAKKRILLTPTKVDLYILGLDIRMFMVFDDVLGLEFLRRKGSPFTKLFTMGRHNYMTTIVAIQYLTGLNPIVRLNSKYIFVLGNITNSEAFFNYFASGYFVTRYRTNAVAKRAFNKVYEACTQNYGALVFNQHSNHNDISSCFFHTRAPLYLRNFKACDVFFWEKQIRAGKLRDRQIRNSITTNAVTVRRRRDPAARGRMKRRKRQKKIH